MKWLVKTSLYFLPFFIWQTAFSTEYQFLQYRVEDGLSTDIIKCVAEDAHGFIWVGTDQGLIQYNGYRFVSYPYATKSPYIKDFIQLKDGRLLVLDDLGLTEIVNMVDTVVFKRVLEGTRNPSDTSLWYAKSLFEDSRGNLWISEPQSVVVYSGDKMKRISFDVAYNSSSFIRSFSFAELPNGNMFIASNNGGFFVYDILEEELISLKSSGFTGEVNHMRFWNGEIYIAGTFGLYKVMTLQNETVEIELLRAHNTVSYIQPINDTELLLSSFLGPTFLYHQNQEEFHNLPFNLTTVNQSFSSSQKDIWLSTEKGLILLKPQIFKEVKNDVHNIYVESIVENEAKTGVYFLTKEHIRTYESGADSSKTFKAFYGGYYLSAQMREGKLWVSNMKRVLAYNQDGTLYKEFDFSSFGRFIFDISFDKEANMWITQEASIGLKKIDKHNTVYHYDKDKGLDKEFTIVRSNEKGVYAGSSGLTGYLYFKGYEDSVFTDISKSFKSSFVADFRVEDIGFDGEDIWLATSVGLFRQTPDGIEQVDLDNKFRNLLTKVVYCQPNTPFVWFSNSYGLIQLNKQTGEYNLYDESHGLQSNSVNSRGLIISPNITWVGTSNGLAYSDFDFLNLRKTPPPKVVQFTADRRKYNYTQLASSKLPSNPYIEMVVSSPVYPGNKVRYQYKINENTGWMDLPSSHLLNFSKLGSGRYEVSLRAKKYGSYTWSEPETIRFTIKKAYYETFLFQVAIVLLVVMLVIITRYTTTRVLRKRQLALERLVEERTEQLATSNKNLMERNRELDQFVYSTSHDLSAPLKSIRGLINVSNYETDIDAMRLLLTRMDASVIKLEKFIKDVISYSRNVRLGIEKKEVHLRNLVVEILDNISHIEYFPQISIEIDIADDVVFMADEVRVRIILNNLLSNAVKFQRIGDVSEPKVKISYTLENERHAIRVADNGSGIPADLQEKIFDMFFRANTTSDGSGLGLYILKETVKKFRGEIGLKSEEGKGSEFTVTFPA